MDWSFSQGCPVSQGIPTTSGASRLDRCSQPFKVLWKLIQRSPNLSKANFAPLLVLLWNQVVLTEVLFEVWCDSQRSKTKTWGVRSNRSYEKLWSTLGETKPERATKPQGAESLQPPPAAHVLHKHQTVSLAKPPSPKWGGYLGNTSLRERAARKTMPKISLCILSAATSKWHVRKKPSPICDFSQRFLSNWNK